MGHKHECHNLVIHCIDFRLQDDIWWWLKSQGVTGDSDIVSVAGAVKELVSPEIEEYRKYLSKQIRISRELHGMKRVILINHTDCGAYGGKKAFEGDTAGEEQKHLEDMKSAAIIIKNEFPDLEVMSVLIKMGENNNNFTVVK